MGEPEVKKSKPFPNHAPPLLGAGGNPFPLPLLLLSLYLLGALLAGLRPLLGLWGIAYLRRACVSVTDAPTLSVSADCAAALRLTRLPLLCRADVPVPMTWGGRRPVVLLPSGPEGWPEDRLRSVLLHEMAHIKRRDWSCHRLADIACALYWFHPLVWLTARRLRSESEIACDDLVISSGIAAPEYARHLLEIAGALSRPLPSQSAIAMAQTPHIKRRITMILGKTQSRRTLTRRALLVAALTGAAAIIPLSTLQPTAKAQAVSPAGQDAAGDTYGIQLLGITNAAMPGSEWWSKRGEALPLPVIDWTKQFVGTKTTAKPGQKALVIAFHLPPSLQEKPLVYEVSGTTLGGVTRTSGAYEVTTRSIDFTLGNGQTAYEAAFPASLATTDVQIGMASDIGTETVNWPKTAGKTYF